MQPLTKHFGYLLGLITGKGYIGENLISIEFPCNNEYIDGIAHCPLCSFLATKPKDTDSSGLRCRNSGCDNSTGEPIPASVKKKYNQAESFKTSIRNNIIPFLQEGLKCEFSVLSNTSGTTLCIELEEHTHQYIKDIFNGNISFTSFDIPQIIWAADEEVKVQFVNGLLDTIGFANAGGWVPRNGRSGYGRMRVYFQVINRNYRLPVAIDNFLRSEFGLPIQTIDWGHPNIRDGNLNDYYAGKKSAMGREHQVKFYPEYYGKFHFRIESKQQLFDELLNHNKICDFQSREDWLEGGIKEINLKKVKSFHPMEDNPLIDPKARRHVDAHWQVNLLMGCSYLNDLMKKSACPELFKKTGISTKVKNANEIISEYELKSQTLFQEIDQKKTVKAKAKRAAPSKTAMSEHDTYPILKYWLESHIKTEEGYSCTSYVTSEQTLTNYLQDGSGRFEEHLSKFENFETLSIRPDLIGFNDENSDFYFIESKITALGLKELGQIMGYCHVANPNKAFLISTKDLSGSLRAAVLMNPSLNSYGNDKKVIFGRLNGTEVELLEV